MDNSYPASILVMGPTWVGDMVISQVLYRALKVLRPDCRIDVICPAWAQGLYDRMPEVNTAIPIPFRHGQLKLGSVWELGRKLRAESYDQAIVIPRSFKYALVPFIARIPQRTGWLGEWRLALLNDIRPLGLEKTMMAERLLSLLPMTISQPLSSLYPQLLSSPTTRELTSERYQIKRSTVPVLALCPGAEYGSAKRWPPQYFAETAKAAIEKGWQVWLLGSERDIPIGKEIQFLTQDACINFMGQTTLDEVVDLLSMSDKVITNDSGLMHIAAALNKPLIALFGSTDTAYTPPLSEQTTILTHSLPCRPCFKRDCPYGHTDCLTKILPSRVIAAL